MYIDTYITQNDDFISGFEVMQLMCDQNAGVVLQQSIHTFGNEMFANMRVHRWQWIVEEIYVGLLKK